jgi:DNA-binding NtrC family response regulator
LDIRAEVDMHADVGQPTAADIAAADAAGPTGPTGDAPLGIEVGISIAEAERRLIEATLERLDGDKKSTAEVLGVSLRTLYNRLEEYRREHDGEPPAS